MKGSPSKCVPLKIDVIGPEIILFAGSSVHLSAQKFYRLKGLNVALVFLLVLAYRNTAQAKEEGNSVL